MSVMVEHYTRAAGDGAAFWFLGTLAEVKASGDETGNRLAVVEFTLPPGFATPPHIHHLEEEGFYILEGAVSGFCGDQAWRGTAGSFIWLPRDLAHGFEVEGERPARVLQLSLPAGFERFVLAAGEPAHARTLPPPVAPDIQTLLAAAARYGQEILGPPGQWPKATGPGSASS